MATEVNLTFINFVITEHKRMQNLNMLTYIRHDYSFKAVFSGIMYPLLYIKTFYISPTEPIYVFYLSLRKNSDYFLKQH
jgi:hypothetical protein